MIEVELHDGRVLQVETDDPAQAAAAGQTFLRREQAPQPGTTGRSLALGAQAVGSGLADVAGAPVDLTTAAINGAMELPSAAGNLAIGGARKLTGLDIPYFPHAPQISDPVGGSESIRQGAGWLADKFGLPMVDQQDMSTGEKFRYGAERFATGAAAQGPMTGTNTAKGLAIDALGGAGAGLGATAAEPLHSPLASLFAALFGGAAGGQAARVATSPKAAVQTAKYYGGTDPNVPYDPKMGDTSPHVGDMARQVLQDAAIDPAQAAATMRSGNRAYEDAGMPAPTSGLLSNDEGMIAVENAQRRQIPQLFTRNDRQVSQGAADQVASLDPGPGVSGRQATDWAKRETEGQINTAQTAVDAARTNADAAHASEVQLGDQARARQETTGDASRRLDTAVVDRTMRPMQDRQNQLYGDIPNDVPMSAGPLVSTADNIRQMSPLGIEPPSLRPFQRDQLVENVPDPNSTLEPPPMISQPRTIASGDVKAQRPALARAEKEARAQQDFGRADALREVKQTGERMINDLPEAQAAVDFTRNEIGPRFGRGEGGRLRKDINRDDLARSNTPPTETAGRFLRPGEGGAEVAADLRRILEGSPARSDGISAARDYVLSDLAKTVGSDGKVSPTRLRGWMANRKGVFEAFPEIRTEVETMARDVTNRRTATTNMQQQLEAAKGGLKRTQRDVENSALSLLVDSDPAKAVGRVFQSRDPETAMTELVAKTASSPDARIGLKKAVHDYLNQTLTKTNTESTAEGSRNVSLAEITNLFTKHEKVLSKLYSPAEMQSLQRAHMAVRDLSRKGIAASAKTSTAEDLAQFLKYTELGLKAVKGQLLGGSYFRAVKLAMQTVPGLNSEKHVAQLIQRSMFDPELAAKLLTTPTSRPARLQWNKDVARILGVEEASRQADASH